MSESNKYQEYVFQMEMACEGCSNAAKNVLGKLGDEVTDLEIDLSAQKIKLKSSKTQEEVLEQLKKTGKKVTIVGQK